MIYDGKTEEQVLLEDIHKQLVKIAKGLRSVEKAVYENTRVMIDIARGEGV